MDNIKHLLSHFFNVGIAWQIKQPTYNYFKCSEAFELTYKKTRFLPVELWLKPYLKRAWRFGAHTHSYFKDHPTFVKDTINKDTANLKEIHLDFLCYDAHNFQQNYHRSEKHV